MEESKRCKSLNSFLLLTKKRVDATGQENGTESETTYMERIHMVGLEVSVVEFQREGKSNNLKSEYSLQFTNMRQHFIGMGSGLLRGIDQPFCFILFISSLSFSSVFSFLPIAHLSILLAHLVS